MRLLLSVMALALAGCALETALPPADDLSREPDYRAIVGNTIGSIVGDTSKAGVMEISGPRRVDAFKGPAWLVCLKSNIYALPRYYAAFIQNERVVESRLAVVLDQCEGQPYTLFNDWMQKSAPPERKPAERDRR